MAKAEDIKVTDFACDFTARCTDRLTFDLGDVL